MTTETTKATEVIEPIAKKATPKKKVSTPRKPRQKKISLASVQAKESAIDTLSTYILDEKTNEVIKYNKLFSDSKIQFLLIEAYEKMKYAEENDIEFFKSDEDLYTFISYLTIKWFTHLGEELKDSSLETDISAMSALVSTGLFKTILNDVFDGNEIQKVLQTMDEHIELSGRVESYQSNLLKQTYESVESPTVKEKISKNSHLNVLN